MRLVALKYKHMFPLSNPTGRQSKLNIFYLWLFILIIFLFKLYSIFLIQLFATILCILLKTLKWKQDSFCEIFVEQSTCLYKDVCLKYSKRTNDSLDSKHRIWIRTVKNAKYSLFSLIFDYRLCIMLRRFCCHFWCLTYCRK